MVQVHADATILHTLLPVNGRLAQRINTPLLSSGDCILSTASLPKPEAYVFSAHTDSEMFTTTTFQPLLRCLPTCNTELKIYIHKPS